MTTGLASRAVRAATFAAVCVVAAGLGHAWASGSSVSWFAMGSAFFGTASAAWWLAGRERGAAIVTGSTVVAQLGLHSLFGLLHPTPAASMVAMGMSGMDHASSMELMGVMDMAPPSQSSAVMFLAHSLAAILCGLWLWRGEAAAFRLGRSLAASVFVPLWLALWITDAVPGRRPLVPLVATSTARERLGGILLQYVVSRRGPPGYAACC